MKSLMLDSHYVVIHRIDRSGDFPRVLKYRRSFSSKLYSPLDTFAQAFAILSEYKDKYPFDLLYIDRVCAR